MQEDKNRTHIAERILTGDQSTDAYNDDCRLLASELTVAEHEALRQLVEDGPVWDGNVISKANRDALLRLRIAARVIVKGESGYTAATYRGHDVYRTLPPKPARGRVRQ